MPITSSPPTLRRLAATLAAEAFSGYVRVMRDAKKLDQIGLIERLRTGTYQLSIWAKDIWEFENGRRIPREPIMSALIEALDLDARHVQDAIAHGTTVARSFQEVPDAAEVARLITDARAFGAGLVQQRILDTRHQQDIQETVAAIPPDEVQRALHILAELYHQSPAKAREYLSLGEFYIGQANRQ